MNIVLIGPPGSGKGTQVEFLKKELSLPALNVGDLLFFRSQEGDETAKRIKQVMDTGGNVDDKTVVKEVEEHLKSPSFQKGFILDGFPRRPNQPKMLKTKLDRVFYLKISDQESVKRLSKRRQERDRKDDKPKVVKKRLEVYHQETEPVINYYRKQGILEEVDGERPIKVIFEDILKRVS